MRDNTISITELRDIGHHCMLPFYLGLSINSDDLPPVHCIELVRSIPGRRLVFYAKWQGSEVFAKVFIDARTATRDGKREQKGFELLSRSNITTPELLFAGALTAGAGFILLFARIYPAVTFQDIWLQSAENTKLRQQLIESIYRVFASHHNAGLIHRDPHQRNFLIAEDVVYTLDCADIELLDRQPKKVEVLDNLATFFAIMHADMDSQIGMAFLVYSNERHWMFSDIDKSMLLSRIVKKRQRSRELYLSRKIFRECTEFVSHQRSGKFVAYRRDYDSAALQRFIESPDQYINNYVDRYLKRGRSSTVAVTVFDEKLYVVKYYNVNNLWGAITHAGNSKHMRYCWINAHRLIINNIESAKPIALIENTIGPFRLSSFFVTEYTSGPNIAEYIQSDEVSQQQKHDLVRVIIKLFSALNNLQISHGNMKAANIIIHNNNPYLVGLNLMRRHKLSFFFKPQFKKDIQRFLENWPAKDDVAKLFAAKLTNIIKVDGFVNR